MAGGYIFPAYPFFKGNEMAFSGYSTVQQLRNNVAKAQSISAISNPNVEDRITEADKMVKTKLSKAIDFALVPADSSDPTFPNFLNKLSQFKAAELVLVRLYGAKRNVADITDITYWKEEYNELLQEIFNGDIDLVLEGGGAIGGTTDTLQVGKVGIRPALGMGEYGGFVSKEGLEEDRPIGEKYDESYIDSGVDD